MWLRAEELDCVDEFSKLGRINTIDKDGNVDIKKSRLECKKLSSSALGDNILKYISMDGDVLFNHELSDLSLDSKSLNFTNKKIYSYSFQN